MTGNREVITGNDFKRMIAGAYSAFLLEYENINALNADSLMDEKAGTHILRTIGAAAMSLRDLQADSIGGVSKRVGSAAVLGAHGNAGVLISQILRGIAKGLAGKYDASSSVFGKSFQYGILYAQRAVNDEVERPLIITAKAVAKGAYNAVRANLPIAEILTEAIKAGGIALSQAEKKNGFVDAGAKALMVFLQGCRAGLDGNYVSPVLLFSSGFKKSHDVPNPKFDIVYTYAVSFSLVKCRASISDLEKMLNPLGKFIANVLRNPKIAQAIDTMRANDGLILGICNGFQALIKSGLLPYGDIEKLDAENPTLFRNNINRHVSHIARTRITSNASPWLAGMKAGSVYSVAVSHGEGKFVASEEVLNKLIENGQVATQYVNEKGVPTMDGKDNLNGSSMAIEGIFSEDGKIFGKMGHSERYEKGLFQNIAGNKDQDIFANGVRYFTHKQVK